MKIHVSQIKTNGRVRNSIGNLNSLAASIADIGLLHPIVVKPNFELIAGYRRLLAVRQLGWPEVEVTIAENINDVLSALKAERDENVCREPFLPSEAVAIGKLIEPLETRAAKENQGTRTDLQLVGKLPTSSVNSRTSGRALDKTAEAVGMGRKTYEKAKAVVEEAATEPGTFGDLVDKMDASGKVDRMYKELQRRKKRRELQSALPATLPDWLITGDFREVANTIDDNSIDLIFTDPPYHKEAAKLYIDLAEFAGRKLKPGGLCIAYSGQMHLPEIYAGMGRYLEYMWTCAIGHSGGDTAFHKWRITNLFKPLLLYGKPPILAWWDKYFDDYVTGGKEKGAHRWQQALSEAEHYIKATCPDNGLVVDPFAGGGTTLLAAKKLGLRYLGIEKDKEAIEKIMERMA